MSENEENGEGAAPGEKLDRTESAVEENPVERQEYLEGIPLAVIVAVTTTVAFLVFLDSSILVTAIPQITTQFHSIEDIGWYGSAYLLANCSLQPLNGKLYAHFHLKYTFFAFLGIFELGSLLCGLAKSSTTFIIGRALAGVGAAGILNGGLEIISNSTPLSKRPPLFGMILGIAQLGTVMGPLIGGALTQYTTWRWCFYINLPPGGLVAIILLIVRIPSRPDCKLLTLKQTLAELDLPGAIPFASTVIMFLLALQWGGQTYAWDSSIIVGLFIGSFVDLCVFIIWERYRGDGAMIPLKLLKQRKVYSSCLNMLFIMGNLIITMYYLPIWFQVVEGTSATVSGVRLLPMILSHIFFAVTAGILVGRLGKYLPFALASGVLLSIGSGLLTTFKVNSHKGLWIGSQILVGSGRGLGFQMPLLAIQSSFAPQEATIGTSLILFCQYFGGAIFSSVGETILINGLKNSLPKYVPSVNFQRIVALGAANVRKEISVQDLPGVLLAYNQSLSHVFYLATAVAIAGFFACWGMGWKGMKKS